MLIGTSGAAYGGETTAAKRGKSTDWWGGRTKRTRARRREEKERPKARTNARGNSNPNAKGATRTRRRQQEKAGGQLRRTCTRTSKDEGGGKDACKEPGLEHPGSDTPSVENRGRKHEAGTPGERMECAGQHQGMEAAAAGGKGDRRGRDGVTSERRGGGRGGGGGGSAKTQRGRLRG